MPKFNYYCSVLNSVFNWQSSDLLGVFKSVILAVAIQIVRGSVQSFFQSCGSFSSVFSLT